MAPPRSRQQPSTASSVRLAPPPQPPRRKPERGVIKSVLLTFFFHVAALLFGVALLLLLALTVCGLGLVLLCICSGSSRSVRVLVASLWRAELWINSLGVDKAKRENAALDAELSDGRSHLEGMAGDAISGSSRTGSPRSSLPRSASRIGSGPAQRGREVTPSVMVLSLMYFLLFKWLFNIIFSSIPLIFWSITIQQFTPLNDQLSVDLVTPLDGGAKYFVGIAVGFLAHQISVTAAFGSVFVSEKMAGFLFEEARHEDEQGTYAPLLHWNAGQGEILSHMYQYNSALNTQSVFDARPPYTATQSMPALYQNPFANGPDDQQLRLNRNASEFDRRTAPGSTMPLPEGGPARPGGPPVPPMLPVPPFPPFPPAPPAMPFGARPNNSNLESAYRGQVEERVVDCCLFKVHVKRVRDNGDSGGRGGHGGRGGRGGRGGEGRGGGGPHGRGRDRDGGRGGGRGGLRLETREHDNEFSVRLNIGDPSDRAHMDGYPLAEPQASARGREFGNHNRFDFGDNFAQRRQPERHELKRTKSFDSLYVTTAGDDMELPPHMRMYEVLDLSPSAPPLHHGSFSSRRDRFSRSDADFPLAQLAPDQIPPYAMGRRGFDPFYPPPATASLTMRKSNSDEGRYSQRTASMGEGQRSSVQQQVQQDQIWHRKNQMEQQSEQMRRQREQAQQQRDQAERQREEADRQRQQALWQRQQQTGQLALPKTDHAQRTRSLPGMVTSAQATLSPASSYMREREVYARERDFHHDGITQAALEGIEKAKMEEEKFAASGILSRTSSAGSGTGSRTRPRLGSRTRPRPLSNGSSTAQEVSSFVADTQFVPRGADQRRISFTGPYQTGASDLSDYEIRDQFGSLPQTFEEDSYLDAFRPPGQSSSETISTLNDVPLYRGPSYNMFSPPVSPTSTSNGSFLLGATGYDLYSPTNSVTQDDDDFPSDQLPQVYRSIRYNPPPRVLANSRFAEFNDVPGRRDKVHFNAFASPSVVPSPKPFRYTVWAFLLNQRDEMREKAEAFDPVGRKLTVDTKVDIRRGALVHVTLETPEGFRIVNGGATQGFPWEGKVCNATFDVQCTDGAAFGRVLFKATIIVGTEVAVMRSYVTVSSMHLDPADLEAQMLDSKLEVLEKTFEEIPYKSLEMKELVGKGYFGDAYRASYNGQDVVVKTIRASEFGETNDQILKEFQHEAAVLNMFGHHPCVVPFVGASTDTRYPLSVVTKYLPYGSLEDNLRRPNAGEKLTIEQKTAMLKDAAAGLLNIHEGGFIHRDIAARNCLVDDNLRVKICDFGLCRRVSAVGGSLMKDTVGPVKYMAPESLQPPHLFSYDSDAYMFGVLMWETYTMSSPFAAMTPVEAMLKVMNGERLAVPENLPESLRSLMETCFHETPAQRPSMFEILSTLESTVNVSSSKAAAAAIAAASASLSSATQLRQDGSIWV